jgi:hypothetical protein
LLATVNYRCNSIALTLMGHTAAAPLCGSAPATSHAGL